MCSQWRGKRLQRAARGDSIEQTRRLQTKKQQEMPPVEARGTFMAKQVASTLHCTACELNTALRATATNSFSNEHSQLELLPLIAYIIAFVLFEIAQIIRFCSQSKRNLNKRRTAHWQSILLSSEKAGQDRKSPLRIPKRVWLLNSLQTWCTAAWLSMCFLY